MKIKKGDVVQFVENHKWCGCLGIVNQAKKIANDTRYMVGVPMPEKGMAYIFCMESKNEIERIGRAVMVEGEEDE